MTRQRASDKFYEIKRGRLGWSAVLYDNSGHSINVINGDSAEEVRGAAQQNWPDVPETRPGRGVGPIRESARYPKPSSQSRFVSRRVADFSTLPELIKHARSDLGATHVAGNGAETRVYFPRGDGQYEEATVWQKGNYWHATGPGARQVVRSLPRGAQPLTSQTMRRASEAGTRGSAQDRERSLDRLYGHTRGRDPYPFPSDRDRGIAKLHGPKSGAAGAPTFMRKSAHHVPEGTPQQRRPRRTR